MATIIANELIKTLKNILNNIPLYFLILWIVGSPRFAGMLINVCILFSYYYFILGNICITYKPSENKHMKAVINLTSLSLVECIKMMSDNNIGRKLNIGEIISHVFTGKLI